MKVVFHPGPHKTGTSSIQEALRLLFGSPEPAAVWYPMLGEDRAHHSLAYRTLGLRGFPPDPAPIAALLDRARRAGTGVVVISSEEFDRAIALGRLGVIREALRGADLHLVITANSLARRCTSLWQQSLKARSITSLRRAKAKLLAAPGMQPDFIDAFVEGLRPDAATVVFGSADDPPNRLIENFLAAAGLDEAARARPEFAAIGDIRLNPSFSAFEAGMIRWTNLLDRIVPAGEPRRRWVRRLSATRLGRTLKRDPIVMPAEWRPEIEALAAATRSRIEALERSGRLKIVGSLDVLGAMPGPAPSAGKILQGW